MSAIKPPPITPASSKKGQVPFDRREVSFDRRKVLTFGLITGAASLTGWAGLTGVIKMQSAQAKDTAASNTDTIEKLVLSSSDWKERLSAEQFNVLRRAGTEMSGSSPLNNENRSGLFHCAGCDLALFESAAKFESGTGWPSFTNFIPGHILTKRDFKLIIPRTEYHCARCDGHQGHVFKDGPKPTGLRYCNNGVALTFVPSKTA